VGGLLTFLSHLVMVVVQLPRVITPSEFHADALRQPTWQPTTMAHR